MAAWEQDQRKEAKDRMAEMTADAEAEAGRMEEEKV